MRTSIVLLNCYSNAHVSMGNTTVLLILMSFPLPKNYVSSKIFWLRETKIREEIKHLSPYQENLQVWSKWVYAFFGGVFFSGLLFVGTRLHSFLSTGSGGFSLSFYFFLKILLHFTITEGNQWEK